MFKSPDGKQVAVAAAAYLATLAPRAAVAPAAAAARASLLDDARNALRKRAARTSAKLARSTAAEFARAEDDLTGAFFGPHSLCVVADPSMRTSL
jgi:hypothetical protein